MSKSRQKNVQAVQVHLEAFNLTAKEILHKKSDKICDELIRIIGALSEVKSPEVWKLDDDQVSTLILNSGEIIHQNDCTQPIVWSLVELITQIAKLGDAKSINKKFQLLSVLARQLHECLSTKSCKTSKLLSLIQLIVQDHVVLSIESYLITLAQDLETFILGDDHKIQLLSSTILSTLLRTNILMVKIVMSHCNLHKMLAIRPAETDQLSLVLESIELRVNKFNLNTPAIKPTLLAKILGRVAANLDISYKNDSYIMISFITAFLEDLVEDKNTAKVLKTLDATDALSKVLDAASFSKTKPQLWQEYFRFVSVFVSCTSSNDSLSIFTNVLKIVLNRLEMKPYKESGSALEVLSTSLKSLAIEELTAADKLNLKFQIEQVIPGLANILLSSSSTLYEFEGSVSCLKLLVLLQSIEPLGQSTLNTILIPDKIYNVLIKDVETCTFSQLGAQLCLHFILLTKLYADISSSWANVKSSLETNTNFISKLDKGLKENLYNEEEQRQAHQLMYQLPISIQPQQIKQDEQVVKSLEKTRYRYLEEEDNQRLGQCLDDLSQAASRLTVEDEPRILPQVLKLQQYIGQEEQRQILCLQESLESAGNTLRATNLTNQHLNQQIYHLKTLLATLSGEYSVALEEIQVTRSQHNNISSAARDQINSLQNKLKRTEAELEAEVEKCSEANEAYSKIKTDLAKITTEMEALIQDRESQETHLKETKAALAKRDDKLKRTMKQLDETQTKLDETQKKNEKTEKSNKSLETLVKNQEEALAKKEKQLEERLKECEDLRKVRDAIFNLSKATSAGSG